MRLRCVVARDADALEALTHPEMRQYWPAPGSEQDYRLYERNKSYPDQSHAAPVGNSGAFLA